MMQGILPMHDGVHPVVPPDKMYEGLVDGEDWYLVNTY